MNDEKSNAVNKWSIRLVACYFCIWGITDLKELLTGTRQAKGFMFLDLGLTYNGKNVDVIAWLGVCILIYTGIQLLRLDSRGRDWALFILGYYSLLGGIALITFLFSIVPSPARDGLLYVVALITSYLFEPTASALLVVSLTFAYSLIPLYVLLRKDVKLEFQKQETPEPKSATG